MNMTNMKKNLYFWNKKKRITNQPTDRRTGRPSYRDARTHLKIGKGSKDVTATRREESVKDVGKPPP